MSLIINIIRIQLSIWVIGSHYSSNANDYTQDNKWWNIFIPQPLMGIDIGAVALFMLFSSFFFCNSFQKFYKLETKDFLKQFIVHWFKRYFQLRSVLIVQALGYQQILYVCFNGGIGRDVYYKSLGDWKFWIHLFFPFFWPGRVWYTNKYISESSWFNLELINIEFFQYVYHFINYFIQKKCNIKVMFIPQFIIGLILYFTNLTGISSIMYSVGYLMFVVRQFIVKKNFELKYKKLLFIILLYLHEMLSRGCFIINFIPVFLILIFDLGFQNNLKEELPLVNIKQKKELSIIEKIINMFLKIQPSLYILHHPFLKEATPKHFDYIKSQLYSIGIGYLIIPYVVIQWIVLSIPLYLLQKPFEEIPLMIMQKNKRKKIYIIPVCIFIILFSLQISNIFETKQMEIPKLWENKCELLLCMTKSIKEW